MDQILSQLMPIHRIGSDGFEWWIGQIEDTTKFKQNVKGSFRYKVRIVGVHVKSCEINSVDDLPWAQVIMPVTSPMSPKHGNMPQLERGQWVVGFYLDTEKQKPIIMGQIPQVAGSTSSIADYKPEGCNAFSNFFPPDINPNINGRNVEPGPGGPGSPAAKTKANAGGGGTLENTPPNKQTPEEKKACEAKPGLTDRQLQCAKDVDFCADIPQNCSKEQTTFGEQLENVVAEMLAAIQNNGGNLGDFLVNKATGELYSMTSEVRKYINKALGLLNKFIAECKGWIIDKLEAGIKDLINDTLGLTKEGSVLNEVTKWFNSYLVEIGCSMADLGKRLAEYLTDILMNTAQQIYQMAVCHVDKLVQGILNEITKGLDELLGAILGPLEEILGAIAGPLNIVGQALNQGMILLGITCTGPNLECENWRKRCTDGSKDKKGDKDKKKKKNFLDELLGNIDKDIDNLFPTTNPDYNIYSCDEAYEGHTLQITTVGFTGGVPGTGKGGTNIIDPKTPKIIYSINDITVTEGDIAEFIVTRTGEVNLESSVLFASIDGTADGTDYIKNNGILGFSPGETEKTIQYQTLFDKKSEKDEDFYVLINNNTPISSTPVVFTKQKGKCTISKKQSSPDNPDGIDPTPFIPEIKDPNQVIDDVFDNDNNLEDNQDGGVDPSTGQLLERYTVSTNKTQVKEGDFVIYTITTKNVATGTIVYYKLSGDNITSSDIVGGQLSGTTFIENNTAEVIIGIEEDTQIELDEVLRFTIAGKGAFVDVTIKTDKTADDFDEGVGEGSQQSIYIPFEEPSVNPDDIITDDNGGIISIPVDKPGDPYSEPPMVYIKGTGSGAVGRALLDDNGLVTEIRVMRPGYGYKLNQPSSRGVRCIIDTLTLIRPGNGYTTAPIIYVNGKTDVAEAIINENGFVIGARILDRITTYDTYPEIFVIGGGGFGAKLIPSFACLDTNALVERGSTKIGTGRYVDCP